MSEDYYRTLGVEKSATNRQITRAYKRLALKYHPDKNRSPDAADRFKEILKAYCILLDPYKRASHDARFKNRSTASKVSKSYKYRPARNTGSTRSSGDAKGAGRAKSSGGARGAERAKGSGGARSTNGAKEDNKAGFTSDLFNSNHQPGTGQSSGRNDTDEDLLFVYDVYVSLEHIASGCVKYIHILEQIVEPGEKIIEKKWVLSFPVNPGCKAETEVNFLRKFISAKNKPTVDIIFIIRDQPHQLFTRDGSNIRYTAKISDQEIYAGSIIEVPTLTNGKVPIKLPPNWTIDANTVATIQGEGLPLPENPSVKGNLLVNFDIKTTQKRRSLNWSFPTSKQTKIESDNEYQLMNIN